MLRNLPESSGKVRKYLCHTCGIRFCDRTNAGFYDLRTSEDKVHLALERVTKGMSIRGTADILKSKPSTFRSWISRSSDHCGKVNKVNLKDVETSKVEMDDLWTIVGEKECPVQVAHAASRKIGSKLRKFYLRIRARKEPM